MNLPTKREASAILAVYNAESTIESCVETLLDQSIPIQIIVVDDGSVDRTRELLKKYTDVEIFKKKHEGPARARNFGSLHAKSEILLFVDADMTFDHRYVEKLIKPVQTGETIGTYTVEERVANWDNIFARCWNIQEGWQERKRFPANPPKYGTDFRAIRKNEFDKVGGFDNLGYTDTWSLYHKLGIRPQRTHAICYHKNPESLAAVFHQARWSAKRPYKYKLFGTVYALIRTAFPFSIIAGVYNSLIHRDDRFLPFKVTYDWGRFVGIVEMMLLGRLIK